MLPLPSSLFSYESTGLKCKSLEQFVCFFQVFCIMYMNHRCINIGFLANRYKCTARPMACYLQKISGKQNNARHNLELQWSTQRNTTRKNIVIRHHISQLQCLQWPQLCMSKPWYAWFKWSYRQHNARYTIMTCNGPHKKRCIKKEYCHHT